MQRSAATTGTRARLATGVRPGIPVARIQGPRASRPGTVRPPTRTGPASTRSAPPSTPTRQPRAITNGSSSTMRRLRAKDAERQRIRQGRSTVASRNTTVTPDNARGARIRQGAQNLRVPGDSGRVRAAQVAGRKAVAEAQARRGARAASQAMTRVLGAARTARNVAGALGAAARGGAFAAGIQSTNTADGTLTAARKRGDYKPKQGPAVPERLTQKGVDKQSFNDVFRSARKSGAKTFTWRGKKYTTEVK